MNDSNLRILAIGAHPDDCEATCAGVAAKWAKRGHVVRFVSATDGGTGHHEMGGAALVRRRIAEARAAADVIGIESQVLPIPNGQIEPNLAYRAMFVRLIREFAPDLVLTHRPNDYHPDHRYTSQLVQDAAYIVTVPNNGPSAPALRRDPVIAYMADNFQRPAPLRPDFVIDIDDVYDAKIEVLHQHVSQFYEWIPWHDGIAAGVPKEEGARRKWLKEWWSPRDTSRADKYREQLVARYGASRGPSVKHAEAFEVCEYGAGAGDARLAQLFEGM